VSEQRRTHLRIDFIVQEVSDDGLTPDDDLRYIKFGDDVPIPHVRDFFDRCGNAMSTMFRQGDAVVCLVSSGPNKIQLIKVVRELTGYGLKEAKDVVEAPSGTAVCITKDSYSLQHVLRAIGDTGGKAEVRTMGPADQVRFSVNGSPLPPIATYVRPA